MRLARYCAAVVLLAVLSDAYAAPQGVASELPKLSRLHSSTGAALRLAQALDALIPALLHAHGAPGLNIALAVDGKLAWEGAYGWSDVAGAVPQTPETVFHSGSMAKVYAGIATMILVDRGELALADPVAEHLAFDVSNPLGGGTVTIGHLLNHSSGLGGDVASPVHENPRSLAEAVRARLSAPVQPGLGGIPTWTAPVGATRQYSNLGVALLGLVVQSVNAEKLSFPEFVAREILAPLGMDHSALPPVQSPDHVDAALWSMTSKGYAALGPVWLESLPVLLEEYPAGGMLSIPRDHLKVLLMMMAGGRHGDARILSEESARRMLTPAFDGPIAHYGKPLPGESQGLIWWLRDWSSPGRAFHHGGGHMFGWRTMGIAWPAHGTALVLAVNQWNLAHDRSLIAPIEALVQSWLDNQPPPLPREEPPAVENAAWKASYLRGALFMEAYRHGLGMTMPVPPDSLERIAAKARPAHRPAGVPALWDESGFLAGCRAMLTAGSTPAALRAFIQEGGLAITLDEARVLAPYLQLEPAPFRSLGGLLLADD
ncbi:MAG: serine hydrolase domain-containing protein [Pseudohaliea sp.]